MDTATNGPSSSPNDIEKSENAMKQAENECKIASANLDDIRREIGRMKTTRDAQQAEIDEMGGKCEIYKSVLEDLYKQERIIDQQSLQMSVAAAKIDYKIGEHDVKTLLDNSKQTQNIKKQKSSNSNSNDDIRFLSEQLETTIVQKKLEITKNQSVIDELLTKLSTP